MFFILIGLLGLYDAWRKAKHGSFDGFKFPSDGGRRHKTKRGLNSPPLGYAVGGGSYNKPPRQATPATPSNGGEFKNTPEIVNVSVAVSK
jgi:hypothetical protein